MLICVSVRRAFILSDVAARLISFFMNISHCLVVLCKRELNNESVLIQNDTAEQGTHYLQ